MCVSRMDRRKRTKTGGVNRTTRGGGGVESARGGGKCEKAVAVKSSGLKSYTAEKRPAQGKRVLVENRDSLFTTE